MRLSINGQTSRPMTGLTRPLPASLGSAARLRAASRQRYGVERAAVEAAMERRGRTPAGTRAPSRPVGKRPARGGRS